MPSQPPKKIKVMHFLTFTYIFCSLLAAFIVMSMKGLLSNGFFDSGYFNNADTMWVEDYLRDLLNQHEDIRTWVLPGALEFFPDMFLYGILRFTFDNMQLAYLVFGLLKFFLTGLCIYGISCFVTKLPRIQLVWFTLITVSLMMLLAANGIYDFSMFYSPAHHHGAITNMFFGLLLMFAWMRTIQNSSTYLLLIFILIVIAVPSDNSFIMWFIAPAVIVIIILTSLLLFSIRAAALVVAILLSATCLGKVLQVLIVDLHFVDYSILHAFDIKSISFFIFHQLLEKLKSSGYHQAILASFVVLVGLSILLLHRARQQKPDSSCETINEVQAQAYLVTFFAVLPPINLMVMYLANYTDVIVYMPGSVLACFSVWPLLIILFPLQGLLSESVQDQIALVRY